MSNLDLCVVLIENNSVIFDKNLVGFFDNNVISYNDGVKNILDLNKLLLERIYDDYSLIFNFKDGVCISNFYDNSFSICLDLICLKVCNNSVYIKYKIVDTGYIYEYSVKW